MKDNMTDTSTRAATEASYSMRVGERIRGFREMQQLSLSELSRRSEVSKGTLSALESGQGNPTIMTLVAIGRVLNLTPSDFLDMSGSSEDPMLNAADLSDPFVRMRLLSRSEGDVIWETFETMLPQANKPLHSDTHDGIEHIFMLHGRALIGPSEAPQWLTKGQTLAFDGSKPHLYYAPDGDAKMLMIMEYPKPDAH